jgi:nucleotide-binding universal stress UspA family protein
LASNTQKILTSAVGSVLLVPASTRQAPSRREARYARILVPFDGSMRAESVVPLAVRLANAHQAELVLAHVVPIPELTPIGAPAPEDLDLRERLVRRNERVAGRYLEGLRARMQASGTAARVVLAAEGDVPCELLRIIERERADLVVLSAHGRTGRTEWTCGSVAGHVIAHCPTPVLVVREPGRAAMAQREGAIRDLSADVRTPTLTTP